MFAKSKLIALLLLTITMLSGVVYVALANHGPAGSHLVGVGPVSQADGYPVWYKDANGLTMQICLDGFDPYCGFLPGDIPNPDLPVSFPDNFPEEAFYMLGSADMESAGAGRALLVLALEAAFATTQPVGAPAPGQQIVFGRVRIRIHNLQPDEAYLVTHPYGQDVVIAEPDGTVFVTEDIGNLLGGGPFGEALNSRIGPFITWDDFPNSPDLPNDPNTGLDAYIGDPNAAGPHAIKGSPFNTNFFRIEGPAGSFAGSPNLCADPNLGLAGAAATDDCIETNLFALQGKVNTTGGVEAKGAVYSRSTGGAGAIDVFGLSLPNQAIQVSGSGLSTTGMDGDSAGNYFARVVFSGGLPASVRLTNRGDVPPSVADISPVDLVVITQATFDRDGADDDILTLADNNTLTVQAVSSDQAAPPTLTAYREDGTTVLGNLTAGSLVLTGLDVPPIRVVVKSSAQGESSEPVQISGPGHPIVPLVAIAGPDQAVAQGAQVTLDGSSSTGDIATYLWEQTSGPSVTLNNANSAVATFTTLTAGDSYTFRLTVDDNPDVQPASIDEVVVTVEDVTAPVADAGPDQPAPGQEQFVVQGVNGQPVIRLDGSNSTGETGYQWTQVGGTAVSNLQGANSATPSFVLADDNPVEFELVVVGPGGSASDRVLITPLQDDLQVVSAQYRRGKDQWDIRGTATILGAPAGLGNTVSIYLGNTVDPTKLITNNAPVDNLGDWRYRGASATPGGRAPAGVNTQQITVVSNRGGGPTQFNATVRN